MIIKTDSDSYYRDSSSSALINNDINALKLYKQQRESQSVANSLQKEVDTLKQDMSEIKAMLSILIKQNNKET